MSNIFGELDLGSAPEVPSGNAKGVWPGTISNAEIQYGSKKNEDAVGLVVTYELEGQPYPQPQWHSIPQIGGKPMPASAFPDEPKDNKGLSPRDKALRSLAYLKQFFLDLEVPEEQINKITPEALKGTPVVVTLGPQTDSNFMQVNKVVLRKPTGSTGTIPSSTPAAAGTNPFE